jgi:membrane protease YdiL (CAAX protease family)
VALSVVIYLLATVLVAKVVGPGAPLATRIVGNIVSSLVAVAAVSGWLRVQGADARALGFVGEGWRADFGVALGGVGLVLLPLLAFAAVLDRLVPYEHPIVDFLDGRRDPFAVVVVIVSAVVVAPLAEEFFFRRVLQGWLEKRLPDDPVAPVLVPAIAFAAAHAGQGLAWVALVPLAIVLGVIARRTGSIVPCILLHAFFNAVSVGLLLLQPGPSAEAGQRPAAMVSSRTMRRMSAQETLGVSFDRPRGQRPSMALLTGSETNRSGIAGRPSRE